MNRALQLVVLLAVVLALALQTHVADAACKVKADDTTGNEADSPRNGTNKIQDAPSKRMTNKISFDVVDDARRKRLINKISFDVPDKGSNDDEDESSADETIDY